ncbi:DUF99 family protein, partial [Candidatus Bathyarchaeota archaeon]|nr:DUF99 family protein [Candidatus Bathyarchaeota archaeon]
MNRALGKLIRFREIKKEIRILGIDDCPFNPYQLDKVVLLGVIFRGGLWFDGAMRTEVQVDGRDSTEKIVEMIRSSTHYKQLRVIMIDSITVAGFNIVDLQKLNDETRLPVIAITKEKPKEKEVKTALQNLPDWKERWRIIENAGSLNEIQIRNTKLYAHIVGAILVDAEKIIRVSSTRANFPEPLRV